MTSSLAIEAPKSAAARLWSLLTRMDKIKLALGTLCMSITSLGNSAMPFLIGMVVNRHLKIGSSRSNVYKAMFTMIGTSACTSFIRTYCFGSVNGYIKSRLRSLLHASLMKQDVTYHHSLTTAEKVNLVSKDVDTVCDGLFQNMTNFFRFSNSAFIMPFFLWGISPRMTKFALVLFPLVGGTVVLAVKAKKAALKLLDAHQEETFRGTEERVSNLRTVKLFGQEEREVEAFEGRMQEATVLNQRVAVREGVLFGYIGGATNFTMSQVLAFGASEVAEGRMNVGQLISFLIYSGFVGAGWAGLGQLFVAHRTTMAAAERLYGIIDREPQAELQQAGDAASLSESAPLVSLEDVTFAYPPREQSSEDTQERVEALSGVSLQVPRGACVGLVGASGSGKSTIVNLLTGLMLPTKGTLSFAGVPLPTLGRDELLARVAVVEQESQLFNLSLRDNVAYGRPDASEEDICAALDAAACTDFVSQLPQGLDTPLGHLGKALSHGQRQRIAIARALLRKPTLLVLDESTSALDGASEQQVLEGVKRFVALQGGAVLTIAHRETVMSATDKLVVLKKGKVVAEGPYNELSKEHDGQLQQVLRHVLESS